MSLSQPALSLPPSGDVAQAGVSAYEAGRHDEAAGLFERAARAGNRLAQFNYAMMLYRGETRAPDGAGNAAWRWLRQAAGAGLAEAQYRFAQLYDLGDGVARSAATAQEWYRRAAEQGHVESQVALATMYFVGSGGAAPDYAKAAQWYLAAARAGEPGAQFLVGNMYEEGYGLPQDSRLAAHWYGAAARQGDPAAAARLQGLDRMIEEGGGASNAAPPADLAPAVPDAAQPPPMR
ncbi:MAG: sel1 repeat family protein [Betaproteobacteria bacterium]|nr:MAG: sel1 repeat family protein [Betaproteobacteria bacterium]